MVHTVHLVYCVSGIETIELLPVAIRYSVHLVYCVSGIETLYEQVHGVFSSRCG